MVKHKKVWADTTDAVSAQTKGRNEKKDGLDAGSNRLGTVYNPPWDPSIPPRRFHNFSKELRKFL